jgi:hypothetical protein
MSDNKAISIYRRLAKRNARLVPICTSPTQSSGERRFGIATDEARPRTAEVHEELLRRWLTDGRIEACEGGYRLSPAGLSWLRRRLAEGDGFQEQHQPRASRVIDFEGRRQTVVVSEPESPLRWLASRKDKSGAPLLAPFQLEAGERLRADYEFAGITARVTSSWNPAAGAGGEASGQNAAAAIQDNVMAARQRVVRALAAVGPELSGVLVDVCCHAKGLEEAEKEEGWPQRSGKVVLQIALTRLARHYGLVSDAQLGHSLRRKLLHWGGEDYRPSISDDEEAC